MVMGVSSWMVRNILSTRGTRGSSGTEKSVKLDLSKGIGENIREILVNVSKKHGISESHQISYLNAFVKLINDSDKEWPIPTEDILLCLRPALVNESNYVRAAALRVVKYLIRTKQDFNACIRLKYPCLLVRSLDLLLDNDCERTQALRVVRRLLLFNAQEFPIGLARCLVSLAMTPLDIRDRLLRATIGTLIELCILNPEVFIASGGVKALTRALCNAGHTSSPRIGETIVGALLYLVNRPETRIKAMISFDCLAAPYTDPHTLARHPEINTSTESQLQWAHYVIVSLLRSWPGVLHFCHPDKDGLRSIVNTLYLNQREIRKAVLDLLYDLLCLAQPEWSDEISVALDAVDPSRYQESFKLSDGFVAAEGKMVLPHISKSRVNLVEVHLSLLLYCFLEVGLLDAIVEVIVSDDTFLSVRATILLGELLHLIHLLLPPECCHLTPAIPNLLSYAVRGRPATSSTCTEKLYPESAQFGQHLSSKQPHMNDRPKSKENTVSGINVNRPRGRVRTLSGQSGRSRTFSDDSSGDRSRREQPSELCDVLVKGESNMDIVNESSASDKIAFSKVPSEAIVEGSTEADGYRCIPDYDPFVDNQLPLLNIPEHLRATPNPFVDCDITINDLGPTHSVDPPYSSRAQQRALTAVSALSQLHRMLRKRPAPASIFLDHFIMCIDHKEPLNCYDIARTKGKTSTNKNKLTQLLTKECEEAIKESGVLNVKDPFIWNWDTIRATLKSKSPCLYESSQRQFLRKLVHFFLPKSRNLLRVDVGNDRRAANIYTLTALELIDCLLLSPEDSECEKLLNELLTGISEEVTALLSSKSAHDCLFSPQNVLNTLCGDYFFHLGHMTRTRAGRKALDRFGLTQQFLDLVTHTNHECYVKIIVSVLDYSEDSMTRKIFNVALSSNNLTCRLYCTKLLHVLLRSPLHNCLEMVDWVVDLLVNQLYDEDRAVVNCAISALDEACDSKEYIEAIVKLRPSLLHLGDSGLLLLIRFLSTQEGFKYLNDANFVCTQLERWGTHYNYKYVCLVESQLCDSLTLHQRGEDGRHCGRMSSTKHMPTDLFLPPHLYGQLTQHEAGFSALKADENVQKLIKTVIIGRCNTEEEILHLKAALWALGHISGSPEGARWARNKRVTAAMVHVVRYCQVYSVRATAFYALNITATTAEGASTLRSVGWHTVRHHRHEKWPVVGSLDVLEDVSSTLIYDTNNYEKDSESNQSQGLGYDLNVMDQIGKSGIFYLPKEPSVTSSDNDDFFNLLHFSGRRTRSSSGGGDSKTVRGRSATLPHYSSGSATTAGDYRINPSTFHHFRSASESKASDPNAEDVMSHYYDFATNTSADLNDLTELNNDDDAYYDDDSSISVKKTVEKKKPSVAGGSSGSNNSVASTSTNSNMSGTGLLNDSIVESGGISGSSSKLHGSVVISDRVQTLSPIPSAGSQATSVSGLKGRNVVAPVGQGQSHGRKSAFSVTNSGSTSRRQSISRLLSHQDALGYATLKSLHRGRRPLPAPAPALSPLSPIELITFQDLRQMSPLVRPRHSENKPLMSEFEAHGVKLNHFLLEVGQPPNLPYQSSRSNIACTPTDDPSPGDKNAWNGSRYIGICLPQRLAELFPNDDEPNSVARLTAALLAMASKDVSRTSMTYDTSVTGTGAENFSSAESETDTGTYTGGRGGGGTTTSGIGSGVDLEPPIKRRHNRSECLLCSVNGRTSNQKMTRWRKVSVSSAHRTRTETESSYGGGGIGESPIMLPWQPKGGLEGVNSVDSSSTDVTTSIAQRSVSDNLRSHSLVRRDLLKLVEQLSNPVLYKTCKQALLHLKQIYGDVFRDICVYCDVYTLISSTYHRIQSRRFLQELFLDVPFTELYEESAAALMSGGGESGEEFDEEFNVTTTGVSVNEQSTINNNNDNESSTSSTTSSNSSCSVNNDYDNATNIDEVATNNLNVATNSNGSSKSNFPAIKLSSSSSGSVPSSITLNSATGNQQLSSLLVLEAIPESDARSDSSELSFNKMDSFLSDIKSTSITTDCNLQIFTSITSQQKHNENNDTEKAKELIKITSDKITELQSSLKLATDKKISEPEDNSNKKTIKSSNPVISNTSAVCNKNSTSKDSKKFKNQSGDKTNKSNNDSVNKKDVVGESSTTVMNKRQRKRATTKEPNRESLEMARPSLRKK